MGKAFSNELAALADTVAWARACDVTMLERFVADVAGLPLVAIGSGGSSTACHLVALLHRARHQQPAFHTTPLDILTVPAGLHRAGAFLASASGKNKDVLAALDACIAEESPAVAAITLRAESPLIEAAKQYGRARVFASDAPSGKDGYLATNSLVATCVLIARAYGFDLEFSKTRSTSSDGAIFRDRHMVQVLFGGWAAPVATDLESKLNESALAAAQLADYRNFGHGRHLWLAKRGPETVVIALVTPDTSALAAATLKLFPKSIPIVRLETEFDGPAGTLDLLLKALVLVDGLGRERRQDPGRPHVPEFGRKLYRLAPPRVKPEWASAVQRKVWASPADDRHHGAFKQALDRFLATISTARIGAVALDYDGTMCTKDGRFEGLRDEIVTECTRLLRAGLHLGIATGRGKSVRQELQAVLERKLWPLVHIGYYNGTDIGGLGDNSTPSTNTPLDDVLARALELLCADSWLKDAATVTSRPHQLTVEPKGAIRTNAFASHVMARMATLDGDGVRVVYSSHSLDVLGPRPGKGALVSRLREKISPDLEVLCVGDRGAWPGNDYALLAQPLSLSVDEVSSLDDSCWNIAPRGVCGPDATVLYLRCIKARRTVGTFVWKEGTAR
jgi:hypothetical protein